MLAAGVRGAQGHPGGGQITVMEGGFNKVFISFFLEVDSLF